MPFQVVIKSNAIETHFCSDFLSLHQVNKKVLLGGRINSMSFLEGYPPRYFSTTPPMWRWYCARPPLIDFRVHLGPCCSFSGTKSQNGKVSIRVVDGTSKKERRQSTGSPESKNITPFSAKKRFNKWIIFWKTFCRYCSLSSRFGDRAPWKWCWHISDRAGRYDQYEEKITNYR